MSKVKPRLWKPAGHRAVDWNTSAITKALSKGPLYAATKEDGFRCHIGYVQPGKFACTTREGIEIESMRPFYKDLSDLWEIEQHPAALGSGQILDAEVIIRGMSFEDMSGHFRREEPLQEDLRHRVQFVIFDVESRDVLEGSGARYHPLRHRRERLSRLLSHRHMSGDEYRLFYLESPVECTSMGDIHAAYFRARLHGAEGLVLKCPDLPYKNRKVTGWWKVKPGCGADFAPGFEGDGTVVDVVLGDEDKSNAGKVVGFRVHLEDSTVVSCTGLTLLQMAEYTRAWQEDNACFFGRQCRVTAMERTSTGSLRHPHFDGFRDIGGMKA